jgi:sugar lactone lactonase YvrE
VRVYRVGDAEHPSPGYLGSFGQEGLRDGNFEFPNGIAVDNRGRVYVTDRENNRVQVWSY